MELISAGDCAPPFCLPDSWNSEVCIEAFKGRWVVLYFYPKDNTTGCTLEAQTFSAEMKNLREMNTIVIGISPDSCESHEKFMKKHSLDLILLSDEKHVVLEKYGVWEKKKLYGREYFGVVRTTYLIDPEGVIAEVWPKVKVKGHADEVKAKVVSLAGK